jgi:hypothetical protein
MSPAQSLDGGGVTLESPWSLQSPSPNPSGPSLEPTAPVFGAVLTLLLLPFLPFAIALRRVGVLPWTIQAKCRPWGKHGPPTIMWWHVKGDSESRRAFQDIVSALEREPGVPVVAGAKRVR